MTTTTTNHGTHGREAAMTCYGQVRTATCVQEWYETASRDAGKRARTCRKAGLVAVSQAMGSQVTNVGRVKMTLVTIMGDLDSLPAVNIERI